MKKTNDRRNLQAQAGVFPRLRLTAPRQCLTVIILALTSITMTTGGNLSGRALARNGAATMDTNSTVALSEYALPPVTPIPPTPGKALSPAPITVGDSSAFAITLSNADSAVATFDR